MTALMELDQASRAAVMIMLLDEEQATQILSQLEPDELKVLGERMCTLGDIDPGMITKTVSDFLSRTEHVGMPAADRAIRLRAFRAIRGCPLEITATNKS